MVVVVNADHWSTDDIDGAHFSVKLGFYIGGRSDIYQQTTGTTCTALQIQIECSSHRSKAIGIQFFLKPHTKLHRTSKPSMIVMAQSA